MKETYPMEENAQPEAAVTGTRRELFKKSSQVAITAPAVALLLSASAKSAKAAPAYNGVDPTFSPGDDGADGDGFVTGSDTPLPPS